MHAHPRNPRSALPPRPLPGARIRPLGMLLTAFAVALALATSGCAGAESRDDRLASPQVERTEAGSYFWLPAVLGESVEVRDSTPALIQCYHEELRAHRDTVEAVTVELRVTDGRLRVRSAPLSERFGTCVDGVTVSWRSLPTDYGEGDLIPLTFGLER